MDGKTATKTEKKNLQIKVLSAVILNTINDCKNKLHSFKKYNFIWEILIIKYVSLHDMKTLQTKNINLIFLHIHLFHSKNNKNQLLNEKWCRKNKIFYLPLIKKQL